MIYFYRLLNWTINYFTPDFVPCHRRLFARRFYGRHKQGSKRERKKGKKIENIYFGVRITQRSRTAEVDCISSARRKCLGRRENDGNAPRPCSKYRSFVRVRRTAGDINV